MNSGILILCLLPLIPSAAAGELEMEISESLTQLEQLNRAPQFTCPTGVEASPSASDCRDDSPGSPWAVRFERFRNLPLFVREVGEKLYWNMRSTGALNGRATQRVTDTDVQNGFYQLFNIDPQDPESSTHGIFWQLHRAEIVAAVEMIRRDQNLLDTREPNLGAIYRSAYESGALEPEELAQMQLIRHGDAQTALRCQPLLLTGQLMADTMEILLWGQVPGAARGIRTALGQAGRATLDLRRFAWRVEPALASTLPPVRVTGWIQRSTWRELDRINPRLARRFSEVMNRGRIVAPQGQQGIVRIQDTEPLYREGYRFKLKILGELGDYRVYGRPDARGHIIYDRIMRH